MYKMPSDLPIICAFHRESKQLYQLAVCPKKVGVGYEGIGLCIISKYLRIEYNEVLSMYDFVIIMKSIPEIELDVLKRLSDYLFDSKQIRDYVSSVPEYLTETAACLSYIQETKERINSL